MGQLIAPAHPDVTEVRFELETIISDSRERIFFVEYANRIPDVEAAFNLLHLLHHLNGTAIDYLARQTLERINPFGFHTLIRHHRAKGRAYRLHVRRYGFWMTFDEKSVPTRLLIHSTANRRPGVDDVTFVHAAYFLADMWALALQL